MNHLIKLGDPRQLQQRSRFYLEAVLHETEFLWYEKMFLTFQMWISVETMPTTCCSSDSTKSVTDTKMKPCKYSCHILMCNNSICTSLTLVVWFIRMRLILILKCLRMCILLNPFKDKIMIYIVYKLDSVCFCFIFYRSILWPHIYVVLIITLPCSVMTVLFYISFIVIIIL